MEILKQDQYNPCPVEQQVMILFAGVENYLSDIEVNRIAEFEKGFFEYMDTHHKDVGESILEKGSLTDEIKATLKASIEEYKKLF
jgi:F-type H+-transporting ATPase subunit alpha